MKVTIKLDEFGQGKIMLGKKDISSIVSGLSLVFSAGNSPRLSLDILTEDLEIISELQESNINIDELKVVGIKADKLKHHIANR